MEDNYPGAVQILDYYHAVEKITEVAHHQYTNEQSRKAWLHTQKSLLLIDQVYQVTENIHSLRSKNRHAKIAREKAIRYYVEHEDRMLYKTYKEKGLLIGSGPIKSTHRNVIHQRLKLSGQKWSIPGAQSIIKLRYYNKSKAGISSTT